MIESLLSWYRAWPGWAGRLLAAAAVVLLAAGCIRLVRGLIARTMQRRAGLSRRADTLGLLLKSVATYAIALVAGLHILQAVLGINVASLLAAAGVVGVAVGFGAQSLVKDVISGFFILFEDQFAVGDLVSIAGFTGTVKALGLRSTCIKNLAGDRFYLPNGTIDKVINHSREQRVVIVKCTIAYGADLATATAALQNAAQQAWQERPTLLSAPPEVLGLGALEGIGMGLRMLCRCEPGQQFALERQMLARVIDSLAQVGITPADSRVCLVRPSAQGESDLP